MNTGFVDRILTSECYIKENWHFYCIGCGGRRAVDALVHFEILKSLYYNPFSVCALTACLFEVYIRWKRKWSGEIKDYSSVRKKILVVSLVAVIGNFLVKNGLLIFGIDLLEDFR